MLASLRLSVDDVEETVGLDHGMLTEFANFVMKLNLFIGVPALLVLSTWASKGPRIAPYVGPLYAFYGGHAAMSRLSTLGFSNVQELLARIASGHWPKEQPGVLPCGCLRVVCGLCDYGLHLQSPGEGLYAEAQGLAHEDADATGTDDLSGEHPGRAPWPSNRGPWGYRYRDEELLTQFFDEIFGKGATIGDDLGVWPRFMTRRPVAIA